MKKLNLFIGYTVFLMFCGSLLVSCIFGSKDKSEIDPNLNRDTLPPKFLIDSLLAKGFVFDSSNILVFEGSIRDTFRLDFTENIDMNQVDFRKDAGDFDSKIDSQSISIWGKEFTRSLQHFPVGNPISFSIVDLIDSVGNKGPEQDFRFNFHPWNDQDFFNDNLDGVDNLVNLDSTGMYVNSFHDTWVDGSRLDKWFTTEGYLSPNSNDDDDFKLITLRAKDKIEFEVECPDESFHVELIGFFDLENFLGDPAARISQILGWDNITPESFYAGESGQQIKGSCSGPDDTYKLSLSEIPFNRHGSGADNSKMSVYILRLTVIFNVGKSGFYKLRTRIVRDQF